MLPCDLHIRPFFLLNSTCRSMFSSFSSRSHRSSSRCSKKHKKHHHRRNLTEGSAADQLKSLSNDVATGMEAIQKEIQAVSSRVTSLKGEDLGQ